ncbi:hypothetical protein [Frankia sp. R82]|uniref:hypothetical protein n=1 Tax=Frankia sp. R82 TaxID=2950553 RepID=UPI002042EEAC|nr:hypothetical protein [Frankia sp. R82]MCM3883977.1 hypothetical protein [Frankia sp. R82]
MPVAGWMLVLVAAAALIVTAALVDRRGGGRYALRRRFGPEYDRAVAEFGNRRAAHRHLLAVAERRDTLTLVTLSEQERAAFLRRWQGLQGRFVDDPGGVTRQADGLVSEVMRARGYPEGSFRERVELLSVDHPQLAQTYRRAHADAHADAGAAPGGRPDTETLRQALLRLRDLFNRLLGPTSKPAAATSATATATPPAAARPASPSGKSGPASSGDPPASASAISPAG